jgi:hypothetical protein
MPGHDLKRLEGELRIILDSTDELLKLIYLKGYTTPKEFALVFGVAQGLAQQAKTLVTVSREIVGQART